LNDLEAITEDPTGSSGDPVGDEMNSEQATPCRSLTIQPLQDHQIQETSNKATTQKGTTQREEGRKRGKIAERRGKEEAAERGWRRRVLEALRRDDYQLLRESALFLLLLLLFLLLFGTAPKL